VCALQGGSGVGCALFQRPVKPCKSGARRQVDSLKEGSGGAYPLSLVCPSPLAAPLVRYPAVTINRHSTASTAQATRIHSLVRLVLSTAGGAAGASASCRGAAICRASCRATSSATIPRMSLSTSPASWGSVW